VVCLDECGKQLIGEVRPPVPPREFPPNWWTPLLSSDGSGKVSNGPGTASFYG